MIGIQGMIIMKMGSGLLCESDQYLCGDYCDLVSESVFCMSESSSHCNHMSMPNLNHHALQDILASWL